MTRQRPQTFAASADPLDNVASFEPRTEKPSGSAEDARRVAEATGFSARDSVPKSLNTSMTIDARSLRTTQRTAQLNISVSPETKNRFWKYAQAHGYTVGEDALLALLARYDDAVS